MTVHPVRGFNYRLLHDPTTAELEQMLQYALALGAGGIEIVLSHYVSMIPNTPNIGKPEAALVDTRRMIWRDRRQEPRHPYGNTPDIDLVYWLAKRAKELGMKVVLKPHIDSYDAGWRGDMVLLKYKRDFKSSYKQHLLRRYVEEIVKPLNISLCFATELVKINEYEGVEFLGEMHDWLRGVMKFDGQLIYAANWGNGAGADYWVVRDLFKNRDVDPGIDVYYPLVPITNPIPTYEQMVGGWFSPLGTQGWERRPIEEITNLEQYTGKQVIVTEVGTGNFSGSVSTPWADPPEFSERNDQLQADYIKAARTVMGDREYYIWEIGERNEVSHSIVGRPLVEEVAFKELG